MFSKNEMSEILVKQRFSFSKFSNFDKNEKSLILLHKLKFNSWIFFLFSKNEISEIHDSLSSNFSKFSNFDINEKSSI